MENDQHINEELLDDNQAHDNPSDTGEEETQKEEGEVSKEKKELTPEQQMGALKRKMTKLQKDNPELAEDKKEEQVPVNEQPLTREESYLIAKGVDMEGLDRVKRIASLDNISLTEAYESDDYKMYVEKKERVAKQKASQLSASRGGSLNKQEKTLDTPGLTDAEHKELFDKYQRNKQRN